MKVELILLCGIRFQYDLAKLEYRASKMRIKHLICKVDPSHKRF